MTPTPLQISIISSIPTAILLAWVPLDFDRDRHLRSWLPRRAMKWKLQRLVIQCGATLIVAGASIYLVDWKPADTASAFSAATQGVAWAIGAFAALRAEITGFKASEATPGFTILRSISDYFAKTADYELTDKVRTELPSDIDSLHRSSRRIIARGWPMDKTGRNPDQMLALDTVDTQFAAKDFDMMHEYLALLVVGQRVNKCW